MSAVTVDLDAIEARARSAKPGRTLLTAIASVLFLAGFVTAKVFAVVWLSGSWTVAAVRVGFEAAHGPTRNQRYALMEAELSRLRAEVDRLGG